MTDDSLKTQPPARPAVITLLIIDDQHEAHQLIALALTFVALEGSRVELLHAYNRRSAEKILATTAEIHLALLDAKLPGGPGSDGRWLIPALIERQILVLPFTVFDDAAAVMQEILGVAPLAKWATPEEIGQHLAAAIAQRFTAGVTQQASHWLAFLASERAAAPATEVDGRHPDTLDLSPGEIAILRCEAEDKTPEVIAQELTLSISTVYGHQSRLMHKLGVPNNPALRRWARHYARELEKLARTRGTP